MHYERTIFENETIRLMINFSGINDDIAGADNIEFHIYAIDKISLVQTFHESLDLDQVRSLYGHLNAISIIKNSSNTTSGKFIETTEEVLEIINGLKDIDQDILKTVLEKFGEKDKVSGLLSAMSETELDSLSAAHKQQAYKSELDKLEKLLAIECNDNIVDVIKQHEDLDDYVAGQPEKIFQNWIEKNLWVFGVEYINKYDAKRIAIFSEGDLLMESMDGFLDLIELKRPKLEYDIFRHDGSHNCYYPSSDLSKVIGQCLFYLQKLDEYKLVLEKEYEFNVLKPRIKIILGRTNDFNANQHQTLRVLNSNLNHIQIISYDYLVSCGRKIISNYE